MTHPEPFKPERPPRPGVQRLVVVLTIAALASALALACLFHAGIVRGGSALAALLLILAVAAAAFIIARASRAGQERRRLPGEVPPPEEFFEVWPPRHLRR